MVVLALAGNTIQLVPDGTLLFHLILVVVMVALLNVTLLKPINRILEERDRRTKGRSTEALSALEQMSAKLREYESRTREARARGYALMEEERSAASREREQKILEVKAEVVTWLDDEKSALQKQQEQAKVTLGAAAQARAKEISGQILGRTINY